MLLINSSSADQMEKSTFEQLIFGGGGNCSIYRELQLVIPQMLQLPE